MVGHYPTVLYRAGLDCFARLGFGAGHVDSRRAHQLQFRGAEGENAQRERHGDTLYRLAAPVQRVASLLVGRLAVNENVSTLLGLPHILDGGARKVFAGFDDQPGRQGVVQSGLIPAVAAAASDGVRGHEQQREGQDREAHLVSHDSSLPPAPRHGSIGVCPQS